MVLQFWFPPRESTQEWAQERLIPGASEVDRLSRPACHITRQFGVFLLTARGAFADPSI
jgi:hypothetical protein